jgi:Zn-dependent protease with chaperone function
MCRESHIPIFTLRTADGRELWQHPGVFERFTEQARDAVVRAQEEARRSGDATIDPRHLVLGLLAIDDSIAQLALAGLGVTAQVIPAPRQPSASTALSGRIPFNHETKVALESALRQSIALGHVTLSTGDLLLGVVANGDHAASGGLTAAGFGHDRVRAAVLEQYVSGVSPEVRQQPSAEVWRDLRMGPAPDRLPARRAGIIGMVSVLLWYAALAAAIVGLTWDEIGPETFGAVAVMATLISGGLVWTRARGTIRRQIARAPLALDPPDQVIAALARRGVTAEVRVQPDYQVRDRCYRYGSRAWIVLAPRTMRRPQTLAFVLAHEVAHLVRNDHAWRRLLAVLGPGLLLGAYVTFDPRAWAIGFAGVIGCQVVVLWWTELACDAFAVRWTGADALRAWAADHRALLREPQNRGWRRQARRAFTLTTHPPLSLRQAVIPHSAQRLSP